MIFSVLIILLIAIIAYFHYVQGLFSATISAVCAAIAAVVAVAYHETVVAMLFKGAVANQAEALVLIGLFAVVYLILRFIVDKTVPGNVRYPLMVDKIGSAIVGIIAGLFATGVLALAAGSLPFGASIAGYSRYSVWDRSVNNVSIPGERGGNLDVNTYDEIKETNLNESKTGLDPSKRTGLIIPVDDMITSVVGQLSTGALSNDRPLYAVHPDWPTELFGERAGVQVGTKHVLLNLRGLQMVDLKDVYTLDSVPEIDSEIQGMRESPLVPAKGDVLKPGPDEVLLDVRIDFDQNAADDDGKVRVSPLSVRLVGWKDAGGSKEFFDYYPIGTLENAAVLLRNKPDDPIIVQGNKSVDFVYKLPRESVFKDASAKPKDLTIKDGVFVSVKRMANLDLSGKVVSGEPKSNKDVQDGVVRKPLPELKRYLQGNNQGVAATNGPIIVSSIVDSNKLFKPISAGPFKEGENVSFASGNATIKNKSFQKLEVHATTPLADLGKGDFPISTFYVPEGKAMIQVTGKPQSGKPWEWNNLGTFLLVDASGNTYQPNGALAEFKKVGGPAMLIANYDADNQISNVNQEDGNVTQVHLLFNVPTNTQITELRYNGETLYTKDVTAK